MATEALTTETGATNKRPFLRAALPYLLSLPALLVCIGILIPFVTAVYYSLLRYNLAFPQMRGFIWFQNYIDFFSDPAFWNTIRVSLLYTVFTVGIELVLGLGIAMLLRKRTLLRGTVMVRSKRPILKQTLTRSQPSNSGRGRPLGTLSGTVLHSSLGRALGSSIPSRTNSTKSSNSSSVIWRMSTVSLP